jgi:hypothetical protein
MKLRTDDDIWWARLLYLGPPGYTLPIQLPYAQYGLFAAIFGALTAVAYLLLRRWEVVGPAFGVSLFVTSYIWGHVDPDRPARKLLATAARDWKSDADPEPGQLPALSASTVRIGRTR